MQSKKYTNEDIVFNYFFAEGKERETYRATSRDRIFFDGDVLYSWGTHFPLAVKCQNGYILNGDTYSNSTSNHQGIVRRMAEMHWFYESHFNDDDKKMLTPTQLDNLFFKHKLPYDYIVRHKPLYELIVRPEDEYEVKSESDSSESCPICNSIPSGHLPIHHCIIPFSALRGARLDPEKLVIIDVTRDFYETVEYKDPATGERKEREVHHLGASLVHEKDKPFRYLSSLDKGKRGYQFYLVKLRSRNVNTVEDAFRDLAGSLTDNQYKLYQEGIIKRQGEWFLIPREDVKTKDLTKQARQVLAPVKNVLSVVPANDHYRKRVAEMQKKGEMKKKEILEIDYKRKRFFVQFEKYASGYILDTSIPKRFILRKRRNVEPAVYDMFEVQEGVVKHFDLADGNGNPHVATEAVWLKDGRVFIRGTLRHPEHNMIRMGGIWHEAIKNTALASWTAEGNVD